MKKAVVIALAVAAVFLIGYAVGQNTPANELSGTYISNGGFKVLSIDRGNSVYHYSDAGSGVYLSGRVEELSDGWCRLGAAEDTLAPQVVSDRDGTVALRIGDDTWLFEKVFDEAVVVEPHGGQP